MTTPSCSLSTSPLPVCLLVWIKVYHDIIIMIIPTPIPISLLFLVPSSAYDSLGSCQFGMDTKKSPVKKKHTKMELKKKQNYYLLLYQKCIKVISTQYDTHTHTELLFLFLLFFHSLIKRNKLRTCAIRQITTFDNFLSQQKEKNFERENDMRRRTKEILFPSLLFSLRGRERTCVSARVCVCV